MSHATPFVEFAAGDVILREGEPASALYIIESGTVSISRAADPARELAALGPGDLFGEMAILQEQAHSASVTAQTPVRALRIEAAAFHGVLRENIEIAVQLLRRLVLRLQAAEQQLGEPSAAPAPAAPVATVMPPATAPAELRPPPAPAPTALLFRHGDEELAVPAGKTDLLVGRPDPATGAIPEVNLGPFDSARTLSRRHARLLLAEGRWMLREEPGVANGTWLNGERLRADQSVSIKAGDRLRFGAIELELLRD